MVTTEHATLNPDYQTQLVTCVFKFSHITSHAIFKPYVTTSWVELSCHNNDIVDSELANGVLSFPSFYQGQFVHVMLLSFRNVQGPFQLLHIA